MIRYLLLSSLLACSILAQSSSQVLRIRPSGGLNTIADDFSMPLEDSRTAHNIDFSENIGGLTVRKGIEAVTTIPTTWDSLVSIYGAYYSDGSQQLFAIADSAGVGYGNIIFGAKGSSSLSSPTVAMGYWSIQNKTKFAMVNDKVFAVNGQQRGFVWDGRNAQRWPLPAPGEPTICPLKYSGGGVYKLNGEYRYSIKMYVYDGGAIVGSTHGGGAISPPVKVSNGRVLLTGFTFPVADSFGSSPDSASIYIMRTKANVAPLDLADEAYLVNVGKLIRSIGKTFDSFYVHNGMPDTVYRVYTDSIPDDSLPTSGEGAAIDSRRFGRVETGSPAGYGVIDGHRYGAPTYLAKVDSSGGECDDTVTPDNMSLGIPCGTRVVGWAWTVSLVDTSNAIESDTSRSLFVADGIISQVTASSSVPKRITIGLPRVAPTISNAMKNIYRALVMLQPHDTSRFVSFYENGELKWQRWVKRVVYDSVVVSPYYLVATVPVSDTSYTDNLRYDSLIMKDRYRYKSPPLFSDIFSFESRLYGIAGSNLYFSVLDTVTRWGALDFISVNRDDGDIITSAFPSRGVIRVLKNRSNYNIFQGANLGWNRTEVSGYFGCIAPNSHAATINGHYYVSDIGVIRETEGANLERTQSVENVSAKLKQFADFSVETARKISAFAIPSEGKVLFSLPDGTSGVGTGDTTYVYDERTNTWASWGDVVFSDATLYGAETGANFVPGDTMYFIRPGERTVYRYGTGTAPVWQWESAPFGMENPNVKQVTSVGVWANNMMAEFGISAVLRNEQQVTVTSPAVNVGALTNGYQKFSFPLNSTTAIYHTLRLSFGSGAGALRAFDIYQTELGEREEQ